MYCKQCLKYLHDDMIYVYTSSIQLISCQKTFRDLSHAFPHFLTEPTHHLLSPEAISQCLNETSQRPLPPHHTSIIFLITLPSHPRVRLRYKNRPVRQRGHVLLWDSHQCLCVYPSTPGWHFITFSLMNSQMILVISSPSISTTGWATLMRLSASVNHTYRRGSNKASFSFTTKCLLI